MRLPDRQFLRMALALLCVTLLAACNTASPPDQSARPKAVSTEDMTASLMRVGYRYKRAGEADQFIMPPERFLVTAIDGEPVTMATTSNVALPVSAGKHSITVAASGGLLKAESIVNTTINQNQTYHVTGWLNNNGPPAFIVWIEDSETGRLASAKISMTAQHR